MFKIGDRVRPTCEKHVDCRKLTGTVIGTRDNNFYKYQVKWDQSNNDESWMSENGLETLRKEPTHD
jgi:hypothetical protein